MTGLGDFDRLIHGAVDVTTPEDLRQKLVAGAPLVVKVGFDPTAPDIHLGHTVLMRKMKHFQDGGHRVIFVVGDFTAMIGDPTGRSKTRPALSHDEILHHAETYKQQAFKILDPERTTVRFNSEWLSALGSEGLVRLAAKYNVARMLERRDFRQRYEAGQQISLHEFLYPLAQAYDSVALEADVELGGTDQLFNLNVGRDIMPAYGLSPQVVLTTPLLEGTDGTEKMSKSLGNAIGVAESPQGMFSKVMSISDALMWRYYALLTDLDAAALAVERRRDRPMESKLALAERIVADFHSAAAAAGAASQWRRVHQQGELPDEAPETCLPAGQYRAHELVAAIGAAASKSAAMRLVRQRAVKLDGEVLAADRPVVVRPGTTGVLAVGPRRFFRLRGT